MNFHFARIAMVSSGLLLGAGLMAADKAAEPAKPTLPQPPVVDPISVVANQLKLTADQSAKFRPIIEDETKQLQSVKADQSLSDDAKRAKIMDTRRATSEKVKTFFTPEQNKTWEMLRPMPKPLPVKKDLVPSKSIK